MKVKMHCVDTKCVLSFLECLASQNTSVHMLANYVPAIKAMFILFHLDHRVLEDPKIKYFIKSVKINRPLTFTHRNIMDLNHFKKVDLLV